MSASKRCPFMKRREGGRGCSRCLWVRPTTECLLRRGACLAEMSIVKKFELVTFLLTLISKFPRLNLMLQPYFVNWLRVRLCKTCRYRIVGERAKRAQVLSPSKEPAMIIQSSRDSASRKGFFTKTLFPDS